MILGGRNATGMYIRRSATGVEIWTPAKLNLLLEVQRKRDDGFHEITTLMTAVDVFDTLYFSPAPRKQLSLSCHWADSPEKQVASESLGAIDTLLGDLPAEADNIVTRAVQLVRQRAGVELGARLRLVKRIPSAAGMGGASSDAAAALVAANEVWNLGWSIKRLATLAAELGSDVPFFLGPGAGVCRGRGEQIEPITGLGDLYFVVVRPPIGLATPEVYAHCRPSGSDADPGRLIDTLRSGSREVAGTLFVNRLQPAAERLCPMVAQVREAFERLDCLGHQMTGSGTAYFGLCRDRRHARRVATQLRCRGLGRVLSVRSVCTGI